MATTVKYYYGTTLIGEGTVAPDYPVTTSAIPAGAQGIKREVWVDGVLKGSDTVNVTVNAATTTIDPDFQNKLDIAAANSFALPPQSELDAENQKIINLKAAGVWDKMSAAFFFSSSPDFGKICVKRGTIGAWSGTFNHNSNGAKGDGTTAYFDPMFIPKDDPLFGPDDSFGLGYNTTELGTKGAIYGVFTGDTKASVISEPFNRWVGINNQITLSSGNEWNSLGFTSIDSSKGATTSSSDDILTIKNDALDYSSNTGSFEAPINSSASKVLLFCRNRADNGTRDYYHDGRLNFFCFGKSQADNYTQLKSAIE